MMRLLLIYILLIVHTAFAKGQNAQDFKSEWKAIEKLMQDRKSKDALEKIEVLHQKALDEDKQIQVLKTLVYKANINAHIKENDFKQSIVLLEDFAKNQQGAMLGFTHTFLAECYAKYLSYNQHHIKQKTALRGLPLNAIQEWSPLNFKDKILQHARLALKYSKAHNTTDLVNFTALLKEQKNTAQSLYSFSLKNILEQLKTLQGIYLEAQPLFLNQQLFFSDLSALDISDRDSNNVQVIIFNTYKTLLGLKNITAEEQLHHRIQYIDYLKGQTNNTTDAFYIQYLKDLIKQYNSQTALSHVYYKLASHYNSKQQFKKALEVCDKAHARLSSKAQSCLALKAQILAPQFSVSLPSVLNINTPSLCRVEHKNINHLYYRIIPIEYLTYKQQVRSMRNAQKINYLLKQKAIAEKMLDLKAFTDFKSHSAEFMLQGLTNGPYVLLISNNKDFNTNTQVQMQQFWVSNLALIEEKIGEQNHFQIKDRISGKNIKKAKIEFYKRNYNAQQRDYEYMLTFKGEMHEQEALKQLIDKQNHHNFMVKIFLGKDSIYHDNVSVYKNRYTLRPEKHTYLFTDRKLYKPGDHVYIKGIVIEKEGQKRRLLQKEALELSLYDANHQKLETKDFTTDEFGSFESSFVLPKGLLNGTFHFRSNTHNAYHQIRIEAYKAPSFEVKVQNIQDGFALNQNISVDIHAAYFNGLDLQNAQVTYKVYRAKRYPRFCYFWASPPTPSDQLLVYSGSRTTNKKGKASLSFALTGEQSQQPDQYAQYHFTIEVQVIDENGESQFTEKTIICGHRSIVLSSNMPEKISLSALPSVEIRAQNLMGVSLDTEVQATIEKLKTPKTSIQQRPFSAAEYSLIDSLSFEKHFSNYLYNGKSHPSKFKSVQTLFNQQLNTAQDSVIDLSVLETLSSGLYKLSLKAVDENQQQVDYEHFFSCYDSKSKLIPSTDVLWICEPKTQYKAGETLKLDLASSSNQLPTKVVIEHLGKPVFEKQLVLNKKAQSIEFEIQKAHEGGLFVHVNALLNNQFYEQNIGISVPHQKELKTLFLELSKKIKPSSTQKVSLLTRPNTQWLGFMYDAALDKIEPYHPVLDIFQKNYARYHIEHYGFNLARSQRLNTYQKAKYRIEYYQHPFNQIDWFSGALFQNRRFGRGFGWHEDMATPRVSMMKSKANVEVIADAVMVGEGEIDEASSRPSSKKIADAPPKKSAARTNFNDHVFFFPRLTPNDSILHFNYKATDQLSKFKMVLIGHDQSLNHKILTKEIISASPLMAKLHIPQFLRASDQLNLKYAIQKTENRPLNVKTHVQVFDRLQQSKLLDISKEALNLTSDQNMLSLSTPLQSPLSASVLQIDYHIKSRGLDDHIIKEIPLLSNEKQMTHTHLLYASKNEVYTQTIKAGKNHDYTLELALNPNMHVIKALDVRHEDLNLNAAAAVFAQWFSDVLVQQVLKRQPSIRNQIKVLSSNDQGKSNLQTNQDFKEIPLQASPWVREALNEHAQIKDLGLLLDENYLPQKTNELHDLLVRLQNSDGGWPWIKSMRSSTYITAYILQGIGQLKKKNLNKDFNAQLINKAIKYLDGQVLKSYEDIKKYTHDKSYRPSGYIIQILYARSYFSQINIEGNAQKAYAYFKGKIGAHYKTLPLRLLPMTALIEKRDQHQELAEKMLEIITQNSITDQRLGFYVKKHLLGSSYYENNIEVHTTMLEAFDEVLNDVHTVNQIKKWLLSNKRTQRWTNHKTTAQACFALLSEDTFSQTSLPQVLIDGKTLPIDADAKTLGYINMPLNLSDAAHKIEIKNESNSVCWGAIYEQFIENLDLTKAHNHPEISIKKAFFKLQDDQLIKIDESSPIEVGDKIKVRMVIATNQDFAFVQLRDFRPAGLEPINQKSNYTYRNDLWFYESPKMASHDVFFEFLPKGTHVFEYDLKASFSGKFSSGPADIQCAYAPEFKALSNGQRLTINPTHE